MRGSNRKGVKIMAINDFNIGFVASLDGTKSKTKLNQDIEAIKKSLKELELKAKLDSNQVRALENQLNSLKVNLNNVSIDKTSLNNLVSQINNSLNGIKLQLPNLNTSNVSNQAQQVGHQIGNNISQQVSRSISSAIQKGAISNLKEFKFDGKLLQNDVAKKALEDFKALGQGVVTVKEEMKNIDGKALLNGFTINIKNAKGEIETLKYALKDIEGKTGQSFQYIGGSINDNGVIQQMNTISAKADSLQTKLEKLKSSYSDMNASRPIKDSNNISALSQQYDKVAKSIENVRNADNASFSSMVSNAQREITLLENMVSQFKNAENVATQMKSVDISSGIAQAQERLGKLKANASGFDQMKQTIVDLDTAIANVGDKSSLDAFINKLKVAESQLGRVKAETKVNSNAIKEQETLANAIAKGREQAELSRQEEQKRQQIAQSNAINKALEEEYQERQKNIQAAQKQAELDKQNALAFTKSASDKLSSAISKYSYGDSSDANAMMRQMNQGLANFGDLSNVQGNITKLSSVIDKIISDLKTSHEQSLQFLNEEIKAEETLQSQKDAFNQKNINGIDYEIQKREEEAKIFSSMLQTQMQEEQKLADQANKIQLSMGVNGDTTSQIDMLRNNFTKLGLSADEVKTKMSGVDTEVKTLQSLMNSGADNSAIVTQFEKLQSVLTQTQNDLKQTRSDYSLLATEQQRLSLANTIEAWNQKNTRATKEVKTENDRYVASLRDLNTQMTKIDFNKINNGFKQNENSMRTLNRLGASLKDQMKQAANSFTQWISVSSAIMGVVYNTKQAVSELKDLDDILTEISKTSDLTTEQLKNLGDTAFDTASKYGKKASDYLTGVQEMYRAGFDNAEQMAELSVLAQSAGDMDATLSNNYLMATNAAYKYKGSIEDLNSVLDSQNYITNNAAISMKDIADATTETASVAAEFGVQIDELSALIATATANTRESGSEVGTALKSILINLQDTTSKPVTDTFDALGISMTKVVDGAEKLKTPIELIYELADAYNSLPEGDVMRANILNDIGQKRHAKVCVVI